MINDRIITSPNPEQPANNHRRRYELDALRAIAISSVLLFHLEVPGFGTGYLGVDLFFVLSGYLMTKTVYRERLSSERASAGLFLLKRFWRLAPSLGIVLLVSLIAAWALFSAEHLAEVGMQVNRTAVMLSNLLFFDQAGYFEPSNNIRPLLHTWSLSVEEQFYVVFAIVIMLSRLIRFGLLLGLLFVVGVALWLALWTQSMGLWSGLPDFGIWPATTNSSDALFYLMPFRLIQFMAGCMLALWHLRRGNGIDEGSEPRRIALSDLILPASAFTLLAISGLTKTGMISPLFASPLATVAALLLLLPNPLIARLGQLNVVGFLARISYQLYLVHWPLIVFWRYFTFRDLDLITQLVLACASMALGWALWRMTDPLTEQSFIRPSSARQKSFRWIVATAILSTITTALIVSIWLVETKGAPWRIPEARAAISANDWRKLENDYCGTSHLDTDGRELGGKPGDPLETCVVNPGQPNRIYTFGDSHARHLIPGLTHHFPEHRISAIYFTSCHAQSGLAGYKYDYEGRTELAEGCLDRNALALSFFAKHPPTTIILHQYDGYHSDRSPAFDRAARALLEQLSGHGHQVTWLGPVVRPNKLLADCAAVPQLYSNAFLARRCQGDGLIAQSVRERSEKLSQLFSDWYISTEGFFCKDAVGACRVTGPDGQALFRDKHHLSVPGSIQFVGSFKDQLRLTSK